MGVGDRNENLPTQRQRRIGRHLGLGVRDAQIDVQAHDLACGPHFRRQQDVLAQKLVEGEDRFFDRPVFRPFFSGEAHFLEALTRHDLRRQLGQRASDGFTDEGHGAGGPWIDLEDVDHFVLHGILNIHQAANPQLTRHGLGVLPNSLKNLGRQGVGR